jgi:hypothetical protein
MVAKKKGGHNKMPNWVRTRIMLGSSEKTLELAKALCDENGDVDFNKLVPMPEELCVEESSKGSDGLALIVAKTDPAVTTYGKKSEKRVRITNTSKRLYERIMCMSYDPKCIDIALSREDTEEKRAEAIELGNRLIENYKKYGNSSWYGWRIDHWGTKWNAKNTIIDAEHKTIEFDTAWNAPEPLFHHISEKTDAKIAFLYADEDIGYNQGYSLWCKGHCDYDGCFDNGSEDAKKLACDVWGCDYDDYKEEGAE